MGGLYRKMQILKNEKAMKITALFLLLIFMAACSGDDIEVEVMPEPEVVKAEPEPVEEIVPKPEPIPEPVVEIVYLPTLESWGIEDGLLEIVDGNCNLPIFRKVPFPSTVPLERIRNWMPIPGGGPECLDDDDEGSIIETPHGTKPSGLGNFYDNVFSRKSGWYFNDIDEVKLHGNSRSFIMVTTHINARGGDDVHVAKGKLFGAYNPDSGEYEDRKTLYETCGIGSEPPLYEFREPTVLGDWQATWDKGEEEVCIRLDSMPGSVKCLVISRTDEKHVKLCGSGGCTVVLEEDDFAPYNNDDNGMNGSYIQIWCMEDLKKSGVSG